LLPIPLIYVLALSLSPSGIRGHANQSFLAPDFDRIFSIVSVHL